jgi:hypothetical protein
LKADSERFEHTKRQVCPSTLNESHLLSVNADPGAECSLGQAQTLAPVADDRSQGHRQIALFKDGDGAPG